jgi:hypothetical protein
MHLSQPLTVADQLPDQRFWLSDPPPDVIQPVQVVAQALAAKGKVARAQSDEDARYRLSDPPPDVIQPVQVVAQALAAKGKVARAQSDEEGRYRLSDPPPDVIQPVQVVTPLSRAAAAGTVELTTLLSFKDIGYAHEIGAEPDPEQESQRREDALLLDYQEMYNIIRTVAVPHSGTKPYSAVARNQEFATPGQAAFQQRQFGLAFGLLLFTQESGLLGTLLTIMHDRAPALFATSFDPYADALLASTTSATAAERLQPVGGQRLWDPSWVIRFQQTGDVPAFQAAQNETAIEYQFRPMLNVALGLGLNSDRGLAMVLDQVVTRGLGGGLRWVVQAAGPLASAALRTQALRVLGFASVTAFQATIPWLRQDGVFGPETHAALVGALREREVTPLPTVHELIGRLLAAAQDTAKQRLLRLQDAPDFDDTVFRLS